MRENYVERISGRFLIAAMVVAVMAGTTFVGRVATAEEAEAVAHAKSLSRAFRGAAKKVMPTVVKIRTTTRAREFQGNARGTQENPFKGTPFEEFFREEMPHGFRHPRIPQRQGMGSGVIIDPAGVVLTNNHVVEGADEVLVELADGRQFTASEIKTDEQTDLAVLKISAKETLPAATMGNSGKLEIGDWVLAVGNPFELELTVSAGIISGKGRSLAAGKRANFLQTDAAINPGNSGGPLVNLDGEVVGINTAIASNTGGYQGVGFAVPIDLAKWVAGQLLDHGTVNRAYLGVAIAEIDAKLARKLGVRPSQGVLVSEVYAESPAAAAGFQAGDVIVTFAERSVRNPRDLQAVVERSPAGSKQSVNIIRDGRNVKLTVIVKPLPGDFGTASMPAPSEEEEETSKGFSSEKLGVEVSELTDQLAKKLGYEGRNGVLVTEVDPRGVAAEVGIRSGMLILRVGKKPVATVEQFEAALKGESLAEGILLVVRTQSGNRFVVVQRR